MWLFWPSYTYAHCVLHVWPHMTVTLERFLLGDVCCIYCPRCSIYKIIWDKMVWCPLPPPHHHLPSPSPHLNLTLTSPYPQLTLILTSPHLNITLPSSYPSPFLTISSPYLPLILPSPYPHLCLNFPSTSPHPPCPLWQTWGGCHLGELSSVRGQHPVS